QLEDYDAARLWFGRALDAVRRAGYRAYLVASLWNLGEISSNLGLHEEARPLIEEAIEIPRSIDDRPNLSLVLGTLAAIELRVKRPAAAARAAGEALGI